MYTLKNNVQLIGRVGANPEVKTFESGKMLANISLATNEHYKNAKGEKVEDTQWHRLNAWGKIAEIAEKYVKKGSEIAISGKLIYKSYEDKQGVKRTSAEIQVNELLLMDKASS